MKRLLANRFVDHALRGAALVVTDRRWAAPLSAAALGFGIFAGVAIGPGAAGTLATGGRQIVEIPASGEGDGQSGRGAGAVASTGSSPPPEEATEGGFEEAILPAVPPSPVAVEPTPAPTPERTPKSKPAGAGEEETDGETQELKGTVAQANPAAGSYALAIAGGELVAVHAPELPEPGTKLSVPVRRLANGTFAEAGKVERERKRATQVEFRGAVTFADPDPAAPAYTVSGRGSSLLVHALPDPAGAAPTLPAIGSYVTVKAQVEAPAVGEDAPRLVQRELELEPGPPSVYLDLAGILREVVADSSQLSLSADGSGEGEGTLTLRLPPAIDVTRLEPGDSYLATATVEPDGSLTIAGVASDEHTKGAEDATTAQGDLRR
ncbi:MAG TPA: hypothetical protein VIS95_01315 [Solirubrobacterales bacterium]